MENQMKRPFVVCHMLASLDGKIDGEFFESASTLEALKEYGALRGFYHCQATLYGTTTMLGGYADGKVSSLPESKEKYAGEDWVNPEGKAIGNFIVSIDPVGELAFSSHTLIKKNRPAAHVIQVLMEEASSDYLAYLRKKGISYLFAGKETLDLSLLLCKLYKLFDIQRLIVAGGGMINWSFLKAGFIDEFSLVVAPVIDGNNHSVSSFAQSEFVPSSGPVPMKLMEVKVLEEGTLWLRYN